ncbi:replicative DNA helicase [Paraburkholderia sp. SOS3]|uniref:replicative DNA helicase n=1 Tax=Paraburkholderia sp. SOS3 TaxID=1926494 RepID=UPI0009475359|nr:replicative DNA helicase [Paraburkholderia sp. SOS3]APR40007.1 replicative DNA helicase [Paraburkholderia sp. SOS3]
MNARAPHDESSAFVPPHSVEAEQFVLGALLMDNDAIDRIGELRAEHFYRHDHRTVFDLISRLIVAGKRADVLTVLEAAQIGGRDEAIGGLAYLNALSGNFVGSGGIARWAEMVIERWRLRGLLAAARDVEALVHNRGARTASELISEAQAKFEPLADIRSFEPQMPGPVLTEIVEEIDQTYHGAELPVVPTGFRDLDAKLGGGMRGAELVIIAGRPSMGKTAIAMAIGGYVAELQGMVLVFSLEMSSKQLHQRNIARVGGIHLSHVLDGKKFVDSDWPKLTHAVTVLSEAQMLVDDTSGLSMDEIASRARTVKRQHGLKLIIVDYLGLMTGGPDERHDLKIGSYSAGLKGLAKQLDVPVIALSQLNRGVEQRPNKRPTMGDLRDSGAIEQDADIILMLYRDEVYNADSPDRGTAEIIVGKQRNGETGPVRLAFAGEYQRFSDLAYDYVPATPEQPKKTRRGFE